MSIFSQTYSKHWDNQIERENQLKQDKILSANYDRRFILSEEAQYDIIIWSLNNNLKFYNLQKIKTSLRLRWLIKNYSVAKTKT